MRTFATKCHINFLVYFNNIVKIVKLWWRHNELFSNGPGFLQSGQVSCSAVPCPAAAASLGQLGLVLGQEFGHLSQLIIYTKMKMVRFFPTYFKHS